MARVFITGSSTGLGLLVAKRLAERGHTVTLHARSEERTAQLRSALPDADVVLGDLSELQGMRQVADAVNGLGRHDAVIHNAAVYDQPERLGTGDGLSLTFAVNLLAPYLLSALIERPDRLVFMTSGMHAGGRFDLDDAQWTRRRWNWMAAYSDSKLYLTTLAFALARRWPQVRSNAVDPGWVPTRMGGAGAPGDLEAGVATQSWLAAGDDPSADVSGRFFFHRQARPAPEAAGDPDRHEALLAYCAGLSGEAIG
jgi:NAD(P)-dependent dehydrogenase (short-subunit alcohol dehydrogenase family)